MNVGLGTIYHHNSFGVSRASRCLNEARIFADVNASGSLVHACKVEWSLRIGLFLFLPLLEILIPVIPTM